MLKLLILLLKSLGLIVIGILISSFTLSEPQVETKIVYVDQKEEFSKEALIKAIEDLNFKHPEIVLAQAKLETGHFESKIFLENNNLFGMKVAYSRPTTAIGTRNGHALYRHWKDSLIDYALYTSAFMRYNSENDVFSHLGKYYAQDPIYEKKVRKVVNDVRNGNYFVE